MTEKQIDLAKRVRNISKAVRPVVERSALNYNVWNDDEVGKDVASIIELMYEG